MPAYPEIKLKKARAKLGLMLFFVSAALFGSVPFLGPVPLSSPEFNYFSFATFLLPAGFLYVYWKARAAVSLVLTHSPMIVPANARELTVSIFLANFNVRSGRGFAYRILLGPAKAGTVPLKNELMEGLLESSEFVLDVGFSEKGGDEVEPAMGKLIFRHKWAFKPVYRKLEKKMTAYYRPGFSRPFLLAHKDGFRFWLRDE